MSSLGGETKRLVIRTQRLHRHLVVMEHEKKKIEIHQRTSVRFQLSGRRVQAAFLRRMGRVYPIEIGYTSHQFHFSKQSHSLYVCLLVD